MHSLTTQFVGLVDLYQDRICFSANQIYHSVDSTPVRLDAPHKKILETRMVDQRNVELSLAVQEPISRRHEDPFSPSEEIPEDKNSGLPARDNFLGQSLPSSDGGAPQYFIPRSIYGQWAESFSSKWGWGEGGVGSPPRSPVICRGDGYVRCSWGVLLCYGVRHRQLHTSSQVAAA